MTISRTHVQRTHLVQAIECRTGEPEVLCLQKWIIQQIRKDFGVKISQRDKIIYIKS